MIYHAYRLTFWGTTLSVQEITAEEDEEAVKLASPLLEVPDTYAVEVWKHPIRVARLSKR